MVFFTDDQLLQHLATTLSPFTDHDPLWNSDQVDRLRAARLIRVRTDKALGMGDVDVRTATLTRKGKDQVTAPVERYAERIKTWRVQRMVSGTVVLWLNGKPYVTGCGESLAFDLDRAAKGLLASGTGETS